MFGSAWQVYRDFSFVSQRFSRGSLDEMKDRAKDELGHRKGGDEKWDLTFVRFLTINGA